MVKTLLGIVAGLALSGLVADSASADASKSVNIFAIPSQQIVDTVAAVSKELKADGMETFYEAGHRVHATLYLTNYTDDAIKQLKPAMDALAAEQTAFPLTVEGIEVTKSNWVFLGVNLDPELQQLADEVTVTADQYRDTSIDPPGWMKHYPEKLPAFERYGSPNVFMQFQPHLTLLANEDNPKLSKFAAAIKASPPKATGRVVGIGIGYADENGQITETIAEYPFAEATD